MGNTTKEPGLVLIRKTQENKGHVAIPPIIMKKIYSIGTLKNIEDGVSFSMKNPMKDALITNLAGISINGCEIALDDVSMKSGGTCLEAALISPDHPLPFPMGQDVEFHVRVAAWQRTPST